MADAHRGLSQWDQASGAFQASIDIYRDLADRLEEARATIRYALVFRDRYLSEQAVPLLDEGLRVVRELGDRRWEARAIRLAHPRVRGGRHERAAHSVLGA